MESNTTTTEPEAGVLWENPDTKKIPTIPERILDLVNKLNEQLRMAAEDAMEVDITVRHVVTHQHGINGETTQYALAYTIKQIVAASP